MEASPLSFVQLPLAKLLDVNHSATSQHVSDVCVQLESSVSQKWCADLLLWKLNTFSTESPWMWCLHFTCSPTLILTTGVKNTWEPWVLHYYLRILIRPLRNWWHSHSWLHVTDREWKTQEMPKHKQANCSITKKRKKTLVFLVIYRNFKVLLSYKSFWATSLPKDGCAFEGESWKIRPCVIKRMLVPLQTNSIAEEIKWCPRIR